MSHVTRQLHDDPRSDVSVDATRGIPSGVVASGVSGRFGRFVERRACVLPEAALVYVPTPKCAYTSLLWTLARFHGRLRDEPTDDPYDAPGMGIHFPQVSGLTALGDLTDAGRAAALHGDGWIRFCVTRSPYDRLASAWLDRVVVSGSFGFGLDDLGLVPNGSASVDVGLSFREFVRLLLARPDVMADEHFAPQAHLLEPDEFPYTHRVDLAGVSGFLDQMRQSHPSRFSLPPLERHNQSLTLDPASLYDESTARLVDELYRDDFERFGYPRIDSWGTPPVVSFDRHHLQMLAMLRSRTERIADLRSVAVARRGGRNALRTLRSAIGARLRPNSDGVLVRGR